MLRPMRGASAGALPRRTRGQAMIEFLLTLPLILLILFLIVSFGKGWRLKQRAVVASRYAAWHAAQTGRVGPIEDFRRDFFYGDLTANHGSRTGPGDGKGLYEARLNLGAGAMEAYWRHREPALSGASVQRAAVDYEPPGEVYKYTLTRIGETTAREEQSWHFFEVNFWRFFGQAIVQEASDRQNDVLEAFDEAGQEGIDDVAAYDDVLRNALNVDMQAHRNRMDTYYRRWINRWSRG